MAKRTIEIDERAEDLLALILCGYEATASALRQRAGASREAGEAMSAEALELRRALEVWRF